ncbi:MULTISPECIES: SDR family oxidoreductase [unclassified Pseudomonas]|uniref:UDP-glucose 4-epimerase family protein n=1 Tax=unclassified Pseudomonas TaxID=196821 RepID=UPI000A1E4970|nr:MULTISPECIES: SDR family oxidoreductase [unclassified Pseudomonas]
MKRTKILVTGASGFVGSALMNRLAMSPCYETIVAVRHSFEAPVGVTVREIPSLSKDCDYKDVLSGVDVLVHCAARVHVMNELAVDPLAEFRSVNVEGTLALARQAAASGTKRFIFLSSIKVNGEATKVAHPFTANDKPAPSDPYAVSKFEAEVELRKIAESTGMELVIVRPPLVYGPGVKANFHAMMRWLNRGVVLPFGRVSNKRSFVAVANLVDLLCVCLEHPNASNETFLVSDGRDLSTTELLRLMAEALGKPARLVPVPVSLMKVIAGLVKRSGVASRLFDSLQVDISKAEKLLGWEPPVSIEDAMKSTAQYFQKESLS